MSILSFKTKVVTLLEQLMCLFLDFGFWTLSWTLYWIGLVQDKIQKSKSKTNARQIQDKIKIQDRSKTKSKSQNPRQIQDKVQKS